MLITEEYRQMNVQLHAERGGYGSKGGKWAPRLERMARWCDASTILDYGCGKGSLKRELEALTSDFIIREYDPAVPGKDGPPEHADLVVCTDVLEHVEPPCIDAVVQHLIELANRAVLVAVACRPGKRVLADGRPDHLTVKPPKWWAARLAKFGDWRTIDSLRKLEHCAVLVK